MDGCDLGALIAGGEDVGHAWVAKGKQGRDVWDVLRGVKLGGGTGAVMHYSQQSETWIQTVAT